MTIEKAVEALEKWHSAKSLDWGIDAEGAVRVVLEAIREPTEEMLDAGKKVDVGHSWGSGTPAAPMGEYCYMPENVWAAMIDAALKEKP